MAEMGLGYGSEFQLMRFLGHHRNYLNKLIRETVKIDGEIQWLDYPTANRLSGDGEWEGISCFEKLENYADIAQKWKEWWPQSEKIKTKTMNWDGIFKIVDTWFFVEAKANEKESYQKCGASSEKSKVKIEDAFHKTQEWLKVETEKQWIDSHCYQLANRLAFLCFCNTHGINAKLLYISFINGFRSNTDEIHSEEEWKLIWKDEFKKLGLDKIDMSSHIYFIYPDCKMSFKSILFT